MPWMLQTVTEFDTEETGAAAPLRRGRSGARGSFVQTLVVKVDSVAEDGPSSEMRRLASRWMELWARYSARLTVVLTRAVEQ